MSIFDWYRRAQHAVGLGEHPAIRVFKKRAKKIQPSLPPGSSLMQAQELVARQNGFNNWHHAQQVAKTYNKPSTAPNTVAMYPTLAELDASGARWLGYDAMGVAHLGQPPSLERTHTLVVGDTIGNTYFQQWLHQHLQRQQPFVAWLNIQPAAWTEPPSCLSKHATTGPLILRLNNTQAPQWLCANLSVHWEALSEVQAWINRTAPTLAINATQQELLEHMLVWLWDSTEGHIRTGPSMATFLTPQQLVHCPQWSQDAHAVLVLAGELAVLFRNAQPFLHNDGTPVIHLSTRELMTYPTGVIILDDNAPESTVARACVQSWFITYVGHCLGLPLRPTNRYAVPLAGPSTFHWYFANTALTPGISSIAAQCRALRIGLTTFYDEKTSVPVEIEANSCTQLVQSDGSLQHANLQCRNNAPRTAVQTFIPTAML